MTFAEFPDLLTKEGGGDSTLEARAGKAYALRAELQRAGLGGVYAETSQVCTSGYLAVGSVLQCRSGGRVGPCLMYVFVNACKSANWGNRF